MNCFTTLCVAATMTLSTAGASASAVGGLMAHEQPDSLAQSITESRDSVPVETIVPVMKPDYTSVDTLTRNVSAEPTSDSRAARRAQRARQFAYGIDSLVATKSYAFYPTTMQAAPKGMMRMIYAEYFYLYFSPVDLEVHLPVERGVTQYVSMLNFDADAISGYEAAKHQNQWFISFSAICEGETYDFNFVISTVTGETILSVQGPATAMRYIGSIGARRQERSASQRRRREASLTGSIATPAPPMQTMTAINPATTPRPTALTNVGSQVR